MKTVAEYDALIEELDAINNDYDNDDETREAARNKRSELSSKRYRQKTIEDTRRILYFFEVHDHLPLPWFSYMTAYVDQYDKDGKKRDPEDIKRETRNIAHLLVRAFGKVEKKYSGGTFTLRKQVGNIQLEFSAPRDIICKKVVTGKTVIPAQAAKEVEEVEWICDDPILMA